MTGSQVVDLFAGPGGWDLAALDLGIDVLGIEYDDAACATRKAAGLKTLQADVSALDPMDFPCNGLIASPPCQAFSMAGKGEGRQAIGEYVDSITKTPMLADERAALGWWNLEYERMNEVCSDERAHLVLEPLRWALDIWPDWIALEQVEPVLPIWEALGGVFRQMGYSVWTGVLSAEQYGVPQTRRRAFLIASKLAPVTMPPPTHQRYIAPKTKLHDKQDDSLFDAGERTRIVHPDDKHLLPWVSMAEALGWGMTERPVTTVMGRSDAASGGANPIRGGSGARAVMDAEIEAGHWQIRANAQTNAATRTLDEPAPTIKGGHDTGERVWEPTHLNNRDQSDGRTGEPNRMRGTDEPAPTIAGESRNDTWVDGRPATTVACDGRVFPPSRTDRDPDYQPGDGPVSQANGGNAVRVTQQEAAILQSFPADYPWQGSKTKQFQQIGNAVPPLLALAVLREVAPVSAQIGVAA